MPILEHDIQIMASQVLADVPEGGGAATGNEIVDGASNNLFPDISELDRTMGRTQLRKVFVAVKTDDTDTYLGAHTLISDAPDDPLVSAVLFDGSDDFGTRDDAQTVVESYLAQGPSLPALLFGDHIAGMLTVSVLQRVEVPTMDIGETFIIRSNPGMANEATQYCRIVDISATQRNFSIPNQTSDATFTRLEVVYTISDPLEDTHIGFEASSSYNDSSATYENGEARLYGSVVADAADYYGIRPLTETVSIGAFSVKADSIFTPLVPSAQVETGLADARFTNRTGAIIASGNVINRTIGTVFTTTSNLSLSEAVVPKTLSVSRSGVTVTDKGGKLVASGSQVGTIDYETGLLQLQDNIFGTSSGAFSVTYEQASVSTMVTKSYGMEITSASQRLTYVATLDPIPQPTSLSVSYMSNGRWYTLYEDGSGVIASSDSSLGAGTLNYSTGTIAVTLGALPDVGSLLILAWAPGATRESIPADAVDLSSRAYFEFQMGTAVKPSSVTVAWNDGTARTATDDGDGNLTGDAAGLVFYQTGMIKVSPNLLPAKGTVFTITRTSAANVLLLNASVTDSGSTWTFSLGGPVKPASVRIGVAGTIPVKKAPGIDIDSTEVREVLDNGSGVLYARGYSGDIDVGTINYSTGDISLNKVTAGFTSRQENWGMSSVFGATSGLAMLGFQTLTTNLTLSASMSGLTNGRPTWVPNGTTTIYAEAAGADGSASSPTFNASTLTVSANDSVKKPTPFYPTLGVGGSWAIVFDSFNIGPDRYVKSASVNLIRNPNASTGQGDPAGSISGASAQVDLWDAGISSVVSGVNGTTEPSDIIVDPASTVDSVVGHTSLAPLKPLSFGITVTDASGVFHSATADADGYLASDQIYGKVNYQTGVVQIYFGAPTAGAIGQGVIDLTSMGIPGVAHFAVAPVQADTIRYNAVAYKYLSLDPDILGLNPVRLPSDGRVPIFRPGGVVVVHHTDSLSPGALTAGDTVNVGRTNIARVKIIGSDGIAIINGYDVDLDTGIIAIQDITGWQQPVTIEHRIEDTALVNEAQINGQLTLTRPMTHNYPAGSYVSSALLLGDMYARVSRKFDQATWTGVWSDDAIGSEAPAAFDDINWPIEVTNRGAVTERWRIEFTNTTAFRLYGEHLGLLGIGDTGADFAPINPASGTPYFTIPLQGWGLGWAIGNNLRFNTVGALRPVWVARVIQQGTATMTDDSFSILARGDVDTP